MKIVQNYVHSFNHFYTYHRFLSIYSLWTFSDVHPHGSIHLHNLVGNHPSCCLLQVQPQDKKSPWTLSSNISTSVNARRSARNMNACSGNVLSKKVLEYQVDNLLGGWEELRDFVCFCAHHQPCVDQSRSDVADLAAFSFSFSSSCPTLSAIFLTLGGNTGWGRKRWPWKILPLLTVYLDVFWKGGDFVRILPTREAITMWFLANQIHSKQLLSPSC